MRGMVQGSHVEVKLAVHAITLLLRSFGIIESSDVQITKSMLHKLRSVVWEDGTRPAFEIYFSRKYCYRCKKLVRRLQRATNIRIKLLWQPRLREFDHAKDMTPINPAPMENKPRPYREMSVSLTDEESPYFETKENDANAEPLQTIEENGIVYYLPTQARSKQARQQQLSAYHLGDIDKPLPPTAENEPPAWYVRAAEAVNAQQDEYVAAVEERAPRPYSMRLT